MAKSINQFAADHSKERMAAFVVLLDANSAANQKQLADIAAQNSVTIPLTIAVDGASGPGAYRLSPDAALTVLVTRRNVVKANLVFTGTPDEKAIAKESEDILAAAARMLAEQ